MTTSMNTDLQRKKVLSLTSRYYDIAHVNTPYTETVSIHNHDYYEVVLYLNNGIGFCIENIKYRLLPNDIIVIAPGKMHLPVVEKQDVFYDRVVAALSLSFVERLEKEHPEVSDFIHIAEDLYSPLVRLTPLDLKSLMGIISDLEEIQKSGASPGNTSADTVLLDFVETLVRNLEPFNRNVREQSNCIIPRVMVYINENIDKNLSLNTISEYFQINKFHLLHEFKKYTNSTVYDYIITKRIILAKKLIRGGHTIKSACHLCGAADYSNFFKSFVKKTGTTPTEYKEQCKK